MYVVYNRKPPHTSHTFLFIICGHIYIGHTGKRNNDIIGPITNIGLYIPVSLLLPSSFFLRYDDIIGPMQHTMRDEFIPALQMALHVNTAAAVRPAVVLTVEAKPSASHKEEVKWK